MTKFTLFGGEKVKVKIGLLFIFALALLFMLSANVKAENLGGNPTRVKVGVWLVNVEKVDLAANSYRLDLYLWFRFNSSEISLNDIKAFEFVNGAPSSQSEVYANETEGYLEYRIRGEFLKTFDFSRYPFETHKLTVELEHKKLNTSYLVFEEDALTPSGVDESANVAGWELGDFSAETVTHVYSGGEEYSRFVFSINLKRPVISAFIKSILPISAITTISLLAFFISPQNFAQRIGLGVTTLMSATAFHLSLLSGIPPTGYLTLADRIMLSIYIIFLYNLSVSVYIMKLVDAKKQEEAQKINKKALKTLAILIIVLVIAQVIL
ncbi:MAG: hypothetical protein QXI91_01295 [Candidatus Bathyarchaeia archaeon]